MISIQTVVGSLLVITGIGDAIKYEIQARKISKTCSSANMSRIFTNLAILSDVTKVIYALIIHDFYILSISILALFCMIHLFWVTYLYYPYKFRKLKNFKRPNLFLYIINSLLPNSIRKHL